jgi:hypothetical protein
MRSNVVALRKRAREKLYVSLQPAPNLIQLAIAGIFHASFVMSEATRYYTYKSKVRGGLKTGECILFVSLTKKMIQFVWAPVQLHNEDIVLDRTVLSSHQHRILKGQGWDPLLLQEWARECGIELTNYKDLADLTRHFHMQG